MFASINSEKEYRNYFFISIRLYNFYIGTELVYNLK